MPLDPPELVAPELVAPELVAPELVVPELAPLMPELLVAPELDEGRPLEDPLEDPLLCCELLV